MPEIEIEFIPHEKQIPFFRSQSKFRLLATGVGFGKTAAGVCELIIQAMRSKPGCALFMAAPTYKMLKNTTMREFMKWCPHAMIKDYNRTSQIVTIVNDVEIIGVAGDREDTIDRVRGMNLGGGYGDEIARSPEYMHEVLVGRIRDPRGPMKIWYTSTHKGRNWLFRLFEEKKRKDGKPLGNPDDYEVFRGTTFDNPYTPADYKQAMVDLYTGPFAEQELYGKAIGYEGVVYPKFNRDIHVINTEEMEFKDILGAVDFGFTNPTAMLKVCMDNDNRYYITKEFYERGIGDSALAEIAGREFSDIREFIADSENPGSIEEFNNRGLRCSGVKKSPGERGESFVMWGIMQVSKLLEVQGDGKPRLFVDERCVNTIMEFENYRYAETKNESNQKELPLKVYDHAMDAIRYLVTTMERIGNIEWGASGVKRF